MVIDMATFPDPNDRSVNQPSIIINGEQVVRIYNQSKRLRRVDKVTTLTPDVINWMVKESRRRGWSTCEFSGNQCILTAIVVLTR